MSDTKESPRQQYEIHIVGGAKVLFSQRLVFGMNPFNSLDVPEAIDERGIIAPKSDAFPYITRHHRRHIFSFPLIVVEEVDSEDGFRFTYCSYTSVGRL